MLSGINFFYLSCQSVCTFITCKGCCHCEWSISKSIIHYDLLQCNEISFEYTSIRLSEQNRNVVTCHSSACATIFMSLSLWEMVDLLMNQSFVSYPVIDNSRITLHSILSNDLVKCLLNNSLLTSNFDNFSSWIPFRWIIGRWLAIVIQPPKSWTEITDQT